MSDLGNRSCESLVFHGVTPQPDNDVSGLGVILAFTISAYTTFIIVTGAYVFGYIDHTLLRPVDIYVHRRSAKNAYREDAWYVAIRQSTLAFSDQQMVTGIAALTAGFIGFANDMSVYHFQMVIYLGWMGSSVHLSALIMLATFLKERRPLLTWRIGGMIAMFALLTVALFPTSSSMWAVDYSDAPEDSTSTGWAAPARCFWFQTYGQGINPDGPLSLVLLILSYLWKVGALFSYPKNIFRTCIRGPPEYWLELWVRNEARRWKAKRSLLSRARYCLAVGFYTATVAQFEFHSSFAASLWLSFLGIVWGTIQIVVPRIQNSWWTYQENTWTFGQITPLVLLIQPIGAVLEHVGDGARQHRRNSVHQHQQQHQQQQRHSLQRPRSLENADYQEKSRHRMFTRRQRNSAAAPLKAFSDVFAELEVKKPVDRPRGDLPGHQKLLYSSTYFQALIVWIQLSIVVICLLVLINDIGTIGQYESGNWLLVILTAGCFIGWLLIWFLISLPVSRIFR